ncbi:MAG: endopeptidase La [Clostridiaceae bacterium]|jgi:ATP-dependent Lon protease|nr:endopeptidase La [Clostridiaceae bacterium]
MRNDTLKTTERETGDKPGTRAEGKVARKRIPAARKRTGSNGSHEASIVLQLPLIPLRGTNVFPRLSLTFDVAREGSRKAIKAAMAGDQMVFLATQRELEIEWPERDDLYDVGCIARIRQVLEIPGNDTIKVLVEGHARGHLDKFISDAPQIVAEVREAVVTVPDKAQLALEAYRRQMIKAYERYAMTSGKLSPEALVTINNIRDAGQVADTIAANVFASYTDKQSVLDAIDPLERAERVLEMLAHENGIATIEKEIGEKVRASIEKGQKEYYLREQLRVIQSELGEREGSQEEVDALLKLLEKAAIPDEYKSKVEKEIHRLAKLPAAYPEGSVLRTYLDTVFELPWGKTDGERLSIPNARRVLDRDHYGLQKVKERVLEYLAVRKLRTESGDPSMKGPILCFVGPPGVGKTSIAKSIASALGRKYVRMSLGGVHDEAEIRGHRRTYVGAMPGRILNAIRQAGTDNPLILLDEIDKLGSDYRGDPSSALLEVLDPEQNNSFRDHYLEIPYDLSHVLFITTANTVETIPQALYDRMEIISLPGYTEAEKIEIASRHLLAKQMLANAIPAERLKIGRSALRGLIEWYTREAGVRQLEREIARLCRKAAIRMAEKGEAKIQVERKDLEDLLGKRIFRFDMASRVDQVGVATGLAWTSAGGDTLSIEVNVMPGSGHLELTGQLGDVMKESAKAAISYLRSLAPSLGLAEDHFSKHDIHVHVPEGATPKDGPSAGITLATALYSALTGRPVRHNVAMTGEITLRGRVLPIGGLKEKVIAARRAGIDTVLVPEENMRDVDEIPAAVLKQVKILYVTSVSDVFRCALA